MEENIIIKGQFARAMMAKKMWLLAAVCFALGVIRGISYFTSGNGYHVTLVSALTSDSINGGNIYGVWYLAAIVFAALGAYFWFVLGDCEITVSDKRVWGKSMGKQVNLPLRQISAVASVKWGGIAVATASGKIKFWFMTNQGEVYNAISELLMKREG